MDIYLIHYGEIGLKGKNRDYFERTLVRNIERALGDPSYQVRRRFSRIVIEHPKERYGHQEGGAEIGGALKFIPGIKYFAKAEKVGLDIEALKAAALELAETEGAEACSFKIAARRADKSFPLDSITINRAVGAHIVQKTGKAVSLKEPELTIYIEIYQDEAYIYRQKIPGFGGLPVGTAGRVIALLSGGIDSPVAASLMMKRSCEVVFLHFFNETIHSPGVRRKITLLGEALTKIQPEIRLYMVPFGELQREIIRSIPSRYRMLVYRRLMMRIADEIAAAEGARALVTGDSLAQVASQTLENLNVIYSASCRPVLAPLIGFDKEETIRLAQRIGTYEISIMPYEDCCSFMVAKHPETRGRLKLIAELEENLPLDIQAAAGKAEIRHFGLKAGNGKNC